MTDELEHAFASAEDYKEFVDSDIWEDLKLVLQGRLVDAIKLLELEENHVKILRHQGKIEEIRFLIELPSLMITGLEDEATKPVEEEKENDGRDDS